MISAGEPMTPHRHSGLRRDWPQAVVFDLDGTLVESAPDIAAALNVILARHDFPILSLDTITGMIGGGVPKLIERALRLLDQPSDGELAGRMVADYLPVYRDCATERTQLFEGARQVLDGFAANGVRMGVCTNKPGDISRRILTDLGVDHHLQVVVGGDSGLARKPDPAPLLSALRSLGVPRQGAVMVGDSAADVGAARAAGVPIVLVSFGYTRTPAEELGGDRVISGFDALHEALLALGSDGASGRSGVMWRGA